MRGLSSKAPKGASLLIAAALLLSSCSLVVIPSLTPVHATGGPSISVEGTTAVEPGTVVTVDGSGFSSADSSVTADLYGATVSFVNGFCPVSGGSFSCPIIVPSVTCYDIFVGCDQTGLTITGNTGDSAQEYASDPSGEPLRGVGLYPASGPPGQIVTLAGDGYVGTFAPTRDLPADMDSSAFVKFQGITVVSSVIPFTYPPTCVPWSDGMLSDSGCSFQVPDLPPGTYAISTTILINGFIPDSPCKGGPCTDEAFYTIAPPSIRLQTGEVTPLAPSSVPITGSGFNPIDTEAIISIQGGPSLGSCPITGGTFDCSVNVPAGLSPGPHRILFEGNLGGDIALNPPTDTGFAVLDVAGPYPLSLSPQEGLVGTVVQVTGWGYAQSDPSVTFTNPGWYTTSTPCTPTWGHFVCDLTVPPGLTAGTYTLAARGYTGDQTDNGNFIVLTGISLNSSTAKVGDEVLVSGTAFAAGDDSVHLTLDGNPIGSPGGCPVSSGAFPIPPALCSFLVPVIAGGYHTVSATGDTGDSVSTYLQVMPSIVLSPSAASAYQLYSNSGVAISGGTVVTVSGNGFDSADGRVGLTVDFSSPQGEGCPDVVASDGTISCSFIAPTLNPGQYPVEVEGPQIYPTNPPPGASPFIQDQATAQFTEVPFVTPTCDFSACQPSFGFAGSSFSLSGIGYGELDRFATVLFNGVVIGDCVGLDTDPGTIGTDPNGCNLTVPEVPPGVYTIDAVGAETGAVGTTQFTVLGISTEPGFGHPGSSFNITGYVVPYFDTQPVIHTTSLSITFEGLQFGVEGSCPVANTGAVDCSFDVPTDPNVVGTPGTYSVQGQAQNLACELVLSDCNYQTSFDVTLPTTTLVSCAPASFVQGSSTGITCSAVVSDASPNPFSPVGTVGFSYSQGSSQGTPASSELGSPPSSCTLSAVSSISDESDCVVTFSPPLTAPLGSYNVTADYVIPAPNNFALDPSSGSSLFSIVSPTSTAFSCTPASVVVGQSLTCTATVTDGAGSVSFSASPATGSLGLPSSCVLKGSIQREPSCGVSFTPGSGSEGQYTLTATYGGNVEHAGSSSTFQLSVLTPSEAVQELEGVLNGMRLTDSTKDTLDGFLNSALNSLGAANTRAAIASLDAFRLYVADQRGKTIPATDASTLEADSQPIVASLVSSTSTAVSCAPPASGPTNTGRAFILECKATVTGDEPGGVVSFSTSSATGSFALTGSSCALGSAGDGQESSCSVTYTDSLVGTLVITAKYLGDFANLPSSGTTTVIISESSTATRALCAHAGRVSSSISCFAQVVGVNPTGTVAWTSSTSKGSFSSATCTLAPIAGGIAECSVTYSDSLESSATITASYSGDSNNQASSGQTDVTFK